MESYTVALCLLVAVGGSWAAEKHHIVKLIVPQHIRIVHHHHTNHVHNVHKVAQPYPVEILKKVHYPVKVHVKQPYPVYLPKPYPVPVEKEVRVPYHVPVEKPVPVFQEKKVPYPVEIPVEKHVPVPVKEYEGVPVKVPVFLPVENNFSQDNIAHQSDSQIGHHGL